jgi:S-adenosylmethionine hydrolase
VGSSVGPDNGLFTFALEGGPWRAVRLDAAEYRLPVRAQRFTGGTFAPAAYLARGLPLERLGEAIGDPIRRPLPRARIVGETLIGEVLRADHFGNLTTSVTAEDLASFSTGGTLVVELDGHALGEPVTTFADGSLDRPACLMGSSGRLEIFVREGSAAALLGAGRGSQVRIRRG